MILFCEECGTRHDIDSNQFKGSQYQFQCNVCKETLTVSLSKGQGKQVQADLKSSESDMSESSEASLSVLVVDDSRLIRKVLRQIIESDGHKKVVGEAEDGKKALDLLVHAQPDVITLDINMPVMDGLTALKHIMIKKPTPTVMISALTQEGALETFDALKYGAIDFLPKPKQVKGADLNTQKEQILRKLELAAAVQIESVRYLRRPSKNKNRGNQNGLPCRFVLAIGAAEGGYGSLLSVIPSLRNDLPAAYVAVLHQTPHHVDVFADYLNQCSQLEVKRATDGTPLKSGTCYLAAVSEYVACANKAGEICIQMKSADSPAPDDAINTMMKSVSDAMKERAAGVILSGTGKDGVDGLGNILALGGSAFVQNPLNCLYKETPLAATKAYTIDYVVSDKQMAAAINSYLISQSV